MASTSKKQDGQFPHMKVISLTLKKENNIISFFLMDTYIFLMIRITIADIMFTTGRKKTVLCVFFVVSFTKSAKVPVGFHSPPSPPVPYTSANDEI